MYAALPSGAVEEFDLPLPPQGFVYPQTAQTVATALAGAILIGVVLFSL